MKAAGVIGWPVAHSLSPRIHRFWLQALGLDGDYSRFAVAPESLATAIRALPALGLAGVNVTVPHKRAVMAHLDEISPEARAVGAVNTVVVEGGRRRGLNTDIAGFVGPLQGLDVGRAAVIGAGGAARAVLAGLHRLGVAEVLIFNRTPARAEELLAASGLAGQALALAERVRVPAVDLLVNATSLGMVGQPALEVDLGQLPATATVYDIVYAPLQTGLLRTAAARGLRTVDGLRMLVGQAAPAFQEFFGVAPPRERDAQLRRMLVGEQA